MGLTVPESFYSYFPHNVSKDQSRSNIRAEGYSWLTVQEVTNLHDGENMTAGHGRLLAMLHLPSGSTK